MALTRIERVKTGIPGLDELIEGGIIKNSSTLISGGTGTGKTILCMQFLHQGATKFNEPGVFLSFEEDKPNLIRDASRFGWDFEKLDKQGKVRIIYEEPYDVGKFSDVLEKTVFETKAKRLVIDSTSVFGLAMDSPHEFRMKLFDLVRLLRKLKVTTLLTSEIIEGSEGLSRFGVEEFVVDGVVVMNFLNVGTTSKRSMYIRKLRSTAHSADVHPLDISLKEGLVVKPADAAFEV